MTKRDEGTKPKGKSRYAKKMARKMGRGRVPRDEHGRPTWMWWLEGGSPR